MYPQGELTRLAAHKAALRRDIALRRVQCAAATAGVMQPLAGVDQWLTYARRLSPLMRFAVLPLGLLLGRAFFPRLRFLGLLERWGHLFVPGGGPR